MVRVRARFATICSACRIRPPRRTLLAIQLDARALFAARWRNLAARADKDVMQAPRAPRVPRPGQQGQAEASFPRPWAIASSHFSQRHAERDVAQPRRRVVGRGRPVRRAGSSRRRDGGWSTNVLRRSRLRAAVTGADPVEAPRRHHRRTFEGLREPDVLRIRSDRAGQVSHPLSGALPLLPRLIDMPTRALGGDQHMPRVQMGQFGASERFAVSPGRERDGYLELPGGPSGHPLSPFYRSGFDDWANGVPTPFLPGRSRTG